MKKRVSAYQDIVNRIHFYMKNPHLNPYDVFDYEGEITQKNSDYERLG